MCVFVLCFISKWGLLFIWSVRVTQNLCHVLICHFFVATYVYRLETECLTRQIINQFFCFFCKIHTKVVVVVKGFNRMEKTS